MAIIAVILVLALLWLALLFLGVPVGIVGLGIGAYIFKTNSEGPDDLDAVKAKTNRRDAVIIGAASAALIVASLVGKTESAINQHGEP